MEALIPGSQAQRVAVNCTPTCSLQLRDVPGVLCPGGGAEGHKCLLSPCSVGNLAGGHRVHAGFTSALASDRSECTWPWLGGCEECQEEASQALSQ